MGRYVGNPGEAPRLPIFEIMPKFVPVLDFVVQSGLSLAHCGNFGSGKRRAILIETDPSLRAPCQIAFLDIDRAMDEENVSNLRDSIRFSSDG